MTKIVIANWKMNPASAPAAKTLFNSVLKAARKSGPVKIVIAPPFVFFPFFKKNKNLALAGQDVFWANSGAYTGEISAAMFKSLGVGYAIVGHSERRKHLGETDELINKKIKAALAAGLKTVLCVGESERVGENFHNFVREELKKDLKGVSLRAARNLIIAYEPIWAISGDNGRVIKPGDLFEMITYIRRTLMDILGKPAAYRTPILYGGSVQAENVAEFLEIDGLDGFLVGHASLSAKEFIGIVKAIKK